MLVKERMRNLKHNMDGEVSEEHIRETKTKKPGMTHHRVTVARTTGACVPRSPRYLSETVPSLHLCACMRSCVRVCTRPRMYQYVCIFVQELLLKYLFRVTSLSTVNSCFSTRPRLKITRRQYMYAIHNVTTV